MKTVTHKHDRETLVWIGERARSLLETLESVSGEYKTELLYGTVNSLRVLEALSEFKYRPQTSVSIKPNYQKIGNIEKDDLVRFEVFYNNDHDLSDNTITVTDINGKKLGVVLVIDE